ncbi:stage III sporulation protein AD [Paenalkalicoccus suaedae]|uniref:Stage III sporulation protein AD n=1 Tax=Paenalkalicoccus suaedae TaxID=2592382 RepID=A0A859FK81_9BACI|nr:stage III sporulation protein AD [Paenalkalicoccus suaedae]
MGICLASTMFILLIREKTPVFAVLLTVATGVLVLLQLMEPVRIVAEFMMNLSKQVDLQAVYLDQILKIIGIAYLAEFAAQIAQDAGQGAMAKKIELTGKLSILLLALPILSYLIETVLTLLPTGFAL